MRATYIGHATLLLEFSGVRVLTDPNFDTRLGGVLARVTPPGIHVRDLPHLDAITVTHAHADHLSFRSLALLSGTAPIYAPPAVARWLRRRGFGSVRALHAGETACVGELRITAAAARHHGARYGIDGWRRATNMYLFHDAASSCLFAGDTAFTADSHRVVADHLWPYGRMLDLALLPIGHAPWWKRGMFRRGHLTAADALAFFDVLRARHLIPYHWGTFRHLTAGPFDAIAELRSELEHFERRSDVRIIEPGASFGADHMRS